MNIIQYSGRRSIRWRAGETRASIISTESVLEIVLEVWSALGWAQDLTRISTSGRRACRGADAQISQK